MKSKWMLVTALLIGMGASYAVDLCDDKRNELAECTSALDFYETTLAAWNEQLPAAEADVATAQANWAAAKLLYENMVLTPGAAMAFLAAQQAFYVATAELAAAQAHLEEVQAAIARITAAIAALELEIAELEAYLAEHCEDCG